MYMIFILKQIPQNLKKNYTHFGSRSVRDIDKNLLQKDYTEEKSVDLKPVRENYCDCLRYVIFSHVSFHPQFSTNCKLLINFKITSSDHLFIIMLV